MENNILINDIKILGNGYIAELLSENYDLEILDSDIHQYGYFTSDENEKKYNGYINSNKFDKIYITRGEHGLVWYQVSNLNDKPMKDWDTGIESIYLIRKNTKLNVDKLLSALAHIYQVYECYCNGTFYSLFNTYKDYDDTILESYNENYGTEFESVYELLDDVEHSENWDDYVTSWNESEAAYYEINGFDMETIETAIDY